MKKRMLTARRFIATAALAITTTLACQTSHADLIYLRANLDNQQERFGGTDPHPSRGYASLVINTDTRDYSISLNVTGIFLLDFIDTPNRIRDGVGFIDPAAPNYTSAHLHNAPPGVNGPVVLEYARPPSSLLVNGLIPPADSNPNPNRTLPITGVEPAGDGTPRKTRNGFKISARGKIPDGQIQPVNGAEPFGPYVHDLDFDGIVEEAIAGRIYTNVHASFFDRDSNGDRELRGQSLPNALIRGQFELVKVVRSGKSRSRRSRRRY